MLTQIEWWGGLIFVVGALTYRMVMGALETEDEGIPWYRLQMHAFYLLPAVVLAGYFYPLERTALQYAYLAVLAASLVMVLVMLAQELMGDTSEDEAPPAEAPGSMGEATKPAAEAEASDGWASVLGAVVLYSPVLVAWVAPRRGPWCKGWCSRPQAFCSPLPAFRTPEALAQMTIRASRPSPFSV